MPLPRKPPRVVPDQESLPWWPEWTSQAACRDHDPEIFFELGPNSRNPRLINRAKKVCWGCPVIRQCLHDNIGLPYGIVGGMTPRERWRLMGYPGRPSRVKLEYSSFVLLSMKPSGHWQTTVPKAVQKQQSNRSSSEFLTSLRFQNGH